MVFQDVTSSASPQESIDTVNSEIYNRRIARQPQLGSWWHGLDVISDSNIFKQDDEYSCPACQYQASLILCVCVYMLLLCMVWCSPWFCSDPFLVVFPLICVSIPVEEHQFLEKGESQLNRACFNTKMVQVELSFGGTPSFFVYHCSHWLQYVSMIYFWD